MPMYYVYVLKINNEFYIGYTEDLLRRVKQHKSEGRADLLRSIFGEKISNNKREKIKTLW